MATVRAVQMRDSFALVPRLAAGAGGRTGRALDGSVGAGVTGVSLVSRGGDCPAVLAGLTGVAGAIGIGLARAMTSAIVGADQTHGAFQRAMGDCALAGGAELAITHAEPRGHGGLPGHLEVLLGHTEEAQGTFIRYRGVAPVAKSPNRRAFVVVRSRPNAARARAADLGRSAVDVWRAWAAVSQNLRALSLADMS
jgi:hypothetical protein